MMLAKVLGGVAVGFLTAVILAVRGLDALHMWAQRFDGWGDEE